MKTTKVRNLRQGDRTKHFLLMEDVRVRPDGSGSAQIAYHSDGRIELRTWDDATVRIDAEPTPKKKLAETLLKARERDQKARRGAR